MRPPSPSISEKEFLFSLLKESQRLDERMPLQTRTPVLTFGPDLGWVECAMGKTRVLAQVEGRMVRPQPERPFEGSITIHSEISPMASTRPALGRRSHHHSHARQGFKEKRCCGQGVSLYIGWSTSALPYFSIGFLWDCYLMCINVWHIRLTLHFRRPEVEVIGDEVTVHSPSERAPVPLTIHHSPYCFAFAFFPDPTTAPVLDPSQLEQRLSAGLVSIALNAQKEICVLQKLGGVPLGTDDILQLVDIAVTNAKETHKLVEDRLKEDWATRKVEVR
ncbi:hypothetical protein D9619_008721 [Psilocybe cf. subviscida]|uniref:Uncharacterized protein n=1 Tax=Psilocybe cf. subviscida TaxID=2480587 RepID=A0A8H5F0J9_9AGAR|nr:hypothetical protein D9619_008721 [Psilocybe cf. subviscida]